MAIKNKIKSALIYPVAVLVVAFVVLAVIMIFVIPAFEDVFKSFGADLPAPTLVVIAMSKFFVRYWYLIFGILGGGIYFFFQSWKRSVKMQKVHGPAAAARAGLRRPRQQVVDRALDAHAVDDVRRRRAAGRSARFGRRRVRQRRLPEATEKIQSDVSTGSALTTSMQTTGVFPVMVLQMCAIGEESGSLDAMLGKAAEFYEDEVDEAVKGLSSLMEPFIIVILGTLIGGIVVSMYLPIFKLGQVVWAPMDPTFRSAPLALRRWPCWACASAAS